MGVLDRVAAWWLSRSSTHPQWFRDWALGGHKSATGIHISQMRALHSTTSRACVSIRSIDVAKLPAHAYRLAPNGEQVIAKDHAAERLLRKPNGWQTRLEFIEQMQASLLLTGNAYAGIVRNGRGQAVQLVPINADRVCLYESPDGDLFYQVTRGNEFERAMLASLPDLIPAADMFHLRGLTLNGVTGLSTISLMRDTIGLDLAHVKHAALMFGNGVRPGGVLRTEKKLGVETIERLKAQWADRYGGDNTGKTPVLEEGLEWQPLTMSFVDAEFDKGRQRQIEEIARIFDVPGHRLGIIPQGGGPAILQAHQMYLNNTVSSDVERWETKLNDLFGLDGETEFVEFDVDYFNRADIQTQYTALRTGIVGSFLKPNDARRKLRLSTDPDGEKLLQPANVVPLGFVPAAGSSGPGSDVTGAPAPGGDGDPAAVPSVDDQI